MDQTDHHTQEFIGQVALVAGGGTGNGRAAALELARRGATVVVTGRTAANGAETVHLIEQAGGKAHFIQADVTVEAEVKALLETLLERFGRLDIAFNNVGLMGQGGPLTEMSESDFEAVMSGNLKSVWLSMKYEPPALLKQGGAIVNNASMAGGVGLPNMSAYAASKHGVEGLTRAAAIEYAKRGVRINAVSPGAIETPMTMGMFGDAETLNANFGAAHPIGRAGKPEEIAQAVAFLASPASSFITGHILLADGGYTAQ